MLLLLHYFLRKDFKDAKNLQPYYILKHSTDVNVDKCSFILQFLLTSTFYALFLLIKGGRGGGGGRSY